MRARPKCCAEILVHLCCVVYIEHQWLGAEIMDLGMVAAVVIAHNDTSLYGFGISICSHPTFGHKASNGGMAGEGDGTGMARDVCR